MLMGVLGHIGNAEEDEDVSLSQSWARSRPPCRPAATWPCMTRLTSVTGRTTRCAGTTRAAPIPYRVRRPDQIARFFAGLELVEPGVVPVQQWRPDDIPVALPQDLTNLGGVGKKVLFDSEPLSRHADSRYSHVILGAHGARRMLRPSPGQPWSDAVPPASSEMCYDP